MKKYYLYTGLLSITFTIISIKYTNWTIKSIPTFIVFLSVLILLTLLLFFIISWFNRCPKCKKLDAIKKMGEDELSRHHTETYYDKKNNSYKNREKAIIRYYNRCKYCGYDTFKDKQITIDGGKRQEGCGLQMVIYILVFSIWGLPSYFILKKGGDKTQVNHNINTTMDEENVNTYHSHPNASQHILTDEDLNKLSKQELQIIRNEIFARHGYIFRKGGKMDTFFRKQKWYQPKYKNVDHLLSEIEKRNIKNIRKFEKR